MAHSVTRANGLGCGGALILNVYAIAWLNGVRNRGYRLLGVAGGIGARRRTIGICWHRATTIAIGRTAARYGKGDCPRSWSATIPSTVAAHGTSGANSDSSGITLRYIAWPVAKAWCRAGARLCHSVRDGRKTCGAHRRKDSGVDSGVRHLSTIAVCGCGCHAGAKRASCLDDGGCDGVGADARVGARFVHIDSGVNGWLSRGSSSNSCCEQRECGHLKHCAECSNCEWLRQMYP